MADMAAGGAIMGAIMGGEETEDNGRRNPWRLRSTMRWTNVSEGAGPY